MSISMLTSLKGISSLPFEKIVTLTCLIFKGPRGTPLAPNRPDVTRVYLDARSFGKVTSILHIIYSHTQAYNMNNYATQPTIESVPVAAQPKASSTMSKYTPSNDRNPHLEAVLTSRRCSGSSSQTARTDCRRSTQTQGRMSR